MTTNSYVIFELEGNSYAIDSFLVEDILLLPELKTIPNLPPEIIGVINIRGNIIPVIDLLLGFGYSSRFYKLTDNVIILSCDNSQVGMVVKKIQGVRDIAKEEISHSFNNLLDLDKVKNQEFIKAVAKVKEDIFFLINPDQIFSYSNHTESIKPEALNTVNAQKLAFASQFTSEEKAILQKRIENLQPSTHSENLNHIQPVAIILLNQELFAIDFNYVQELINISKVTLIPCCPNHIIGNMNLRGEILTLIDVRHLLDISATEMILSSQAIVVEVEEIIAGIVVEKVKDIIFIEPKNISNNLETLDNIKDEYIQGSIYYKNQKIKMLDLSKILLSKDLIVEEMV